MRNENRVQYTGNYFTDMVLNFFSQLLSTGCIVNIMLQGVKRDCRGIQGVKGGYKGL